jgi:hypothetical protein
MGATGIGSFQIPIRQGRHSEKYYAGLKSPSALRMQFCEAKLSQNGTELASEKPPEIRSSVLKSTVWCLDQGVANVSSMFSLPDAKIKETQSVMLVYCMQCR